MLQGARDRRGAHSHHPCGANSNDLGFIECLRWPGLIQILIMVLWGGTVIIPLYKRGMEFIVQIMISQSLSEFSLYWKHQDKPSERQIPGLPTLASWSRTRSLHFDTYTQVPLTPV